MVGCCTLAADLHDASMMLHGVGAGQPMCRQEVDSMALHATQLHLMWRSAPGEGVLGRGAGSCRAAALPRSSAATRCSALSAARLALRTWEARSWTKPLLSRRTSSNSAADALSFSVTRPCKMSRHSNSSWRRARARIRDAYSHIRLKCALTQRYGECEARQSALRACTDLQDVQLLLQAATLRAAGFGSVAARAGGRAPGQPGLPGRQRRRCLGLRLDRALRLRQRSGRLGAGGRQQPAQALDLSVVRAEARGFLQHVIMLCSAGTPGISQIREALSDIFSFVLIP